MRNLLRNEINQNYGQQEVDIPIISSVVYTRMNDIEFMTWKLLDDICG